MLFYHVFFLKMTDKKFNFGGEKSAVKTVLPFIKTAVIELGTCAGHLRLGILNFAYGTFYWSQLQ